MESNTRLIDLRQFFKYLKEKALILIACVVLLAVAMTALGYVKQKRSLNVTAGKTSIQTIMQQNRNSADSKNYPDVKSTDKSRPDGAYNASAYIYAEFDYQAYGVDSGSDISRIKSYVDKDVDNLIYLRSMLESVIEDLDLESFDDMEGMSWEDLQYMINVNTEGMNIIIITVTDVDASRAALIANDLAEKFSVSASEYMNVNDIYVKDEAEVPEEPEEVQPAKAAPCVSKKAVVKYCAAGAVGGCALAVIALFAAFIIKDSVRTDSDVAYLGLSLYGQIPADEKLYPSAIKRIAIGLSVGEAKKIVFTGSSEKVDTKKIVSDIKKALKDLPSGVNKDLDLVATPDIKNNSDVLLEVKDCDAIYYLVDYDKTSVKEAKAASSEIAKAGRTVSGVIIVNKK